MKRFRQPKCPYCGDRLNFAQAWVLKRRGEYICPKCGGLSNVRLDPLVYRLGLFAVAVGAMFFLAGLIFGSSLAPITLTGIFLPFLVFFPVSVFLVRLKKPAPPRPRPDTATHVYDTNMRGKGESG